MTWANEIQKNNVLQFKINELEKTNANLQALVGAILTVTGPITVMADALNSNYALHIFRANDTVTFSTTIWNMDVLDLTALGHDDASPWPYQGVV